MYMLFLVMIYSIMSTGRCSSTTEYYKKLIDEKTTEAKTYKMPKSKSEFKGGYESTQTKDFGCYDFIIVGSGSAGSVLATRLSEKEDWNILLLEAGGEEDVFCQIPAMWFYPPMSDKNWGYYSTSQTNCCLGMNDTKCMVTQGKVIGGSSSINGMMYVRGNKHDYDKWKNLGNDGWGYDDVLPFFKKSENSQIDGDAGYHGKGGLWNVQYSVPPSPVSAMFIDASKELNSSILDYNGQEEIGSARPQFNIKHGRRQSSATAFLDLSIRRKNLKVLTRTLVTRILIDPETKEATGVEFVTKDQKFTAIASKEVIVSAGAINSPQLLMLSGIGPKQHLKEKGIKTIVSLPVGQNLMEHPLLPMVLTTNYTVPEMALEEVINLYLDGLGPLTASAGVHAFSFIHTGEGNEEVPSVEIIVSPPSGADLSILTRMVNYNKEITDSFLRKINTKRDILLLVSLLHEKSRGAITLKSSNPLDFPVVDLNLFANKQDIDTLIEAVMYITKLSQTEALQKINATLFKIPICAEVQNDCKQFWNCVIRRVAFSISHFAGTTAMGQNNKNSVVDNNLKVHGVKRLRVMDAGVIPVTISGHTGAPAVMIGEKGADIIKNEYSSRD